MVYNIFFEIKHMARKSFFHEASTHGFGIYHAIHHIVVAQGDRMHYLICASRCTDYQQNDCGAEEALAVRVTMPLV